MAENFYTVVTKNGHQKMAAALAQGDKVTLTQLGVGDANGTSYEPDEAQTALKKERHRAQLSRVVQDEKNPYWFIAEAVIPDDVGGFYIREVALYDKDGDVFAVGKIPETYKPLLSSGSDKQIYIRLIFQVSNSDSVKIVIDPSLITVTRDTMNAVIEGAINGLDWKPSVRAATTKHIVLKGLQVIDEIGLKAGDRVLVKDQNDLRDNGIYIVSTGVWTRSKDFSGKVPFSYGLIVSVSSGTASGGMLWLLPVDREMVIGDDNLTFYALGRGSTSPFGDEMMFVMFDNTCPNALFRNRFGFLYHATQDKTGALVRVCNGDHKAALMLFEPSGQIANYYTEHTNNATEIPWTSWQATSAVSAAHLITRNYLDQRMSGGAGCIGSFIRHLAGDQLPGTILLTSTLQKIPYAGNEALCDAIGETYGLIENKTYTIPTNLYANGGPLPAGMAISIIAK